MSVFIGSGGRSSKGISTPYMLSIKDRLYEMPSYKHIIGIQDKKIYYLAENGTVVDAYNSTVPGYSVFTIDIETGEIKLFSPIQFYNLSYNTSDNNPTSIRNNSFPCNSNFDFIYNDTIYYSICHNVPGPGSSESTHRWYCYKLRRGSSTPTQLGRFDSKFETTSTGGRGCSPTLIRYHSGVWYIEVYYDVDKIYTLRKITDAEMTAQKYINANIDTWTNNIVWKYDADYVSSTYPEYTRGANWCDNDCIHDGIYNYITRERVYNDNLSGILPFPNTSNKYVLRNSGLDTCFTIYNFDGEKEIIFPEISWSFGDIRGSADHFKCLIVDNYLYRAFDNYMYRIKIG